MNDLTIRTAQLPDNIKDLSRFALVGREKLASVRAEIRAIEKVGLAKEVLEQKKAEAQDIAELVTLSELKIGGMLKQIPKATPNNNPFHENNAEGNFVKTKTEIVQELGFGHNQVSQLQRMADHENLVIEAMAEARENDDIISRAAVLRKIEDAKKPHVANNSGNNEWYTPVEIIEAAREAMGSIDLDPASSDKAQEVVKAGTYYTIDTNGLDKEWFGNVWMNPPYATDLIGLFIKKLGDECENFEQAVVLVNNATETEWFNELISIASAVCFPKGRVRFYTPEGKTGAPLQGQAVVYIGSRIDKFMKAFFEIGWGAYL